jgi:hypothetical protein
MADKTGKLGDQSVVDGDDASPIGMLGRSGLGMTRGDVGLQQVGPRLAAERLAPLKAEIPRSLKKRSQRARFCSKNGTGVPSDNVRAPSREARISFYPDDQRRPPRSTPLATIFQTR